MIEGEDLDKEVLSYALKWDNIQNVELNFIKTKKIGCITIKVADAKKATIHKMNFTNFKQASDMFDLLINSWIQKGKINKAGGLKLKQNKDQGVVLFKDDHLFFKNTSNDIDGVLYELAFYKDDGERYGILELGIPMKGSMKYRILPVLEHSKGKCDLVVTLKIKGKKPKVIYTGYFLKSGGTWALHPTKI